MASHNSCISFSYTTIYPVVKKEIKKKLRANLMHFIHIVVVETSLYQQLGIFFIICNSKRPPLL